MDANNQKLVSLLTLICSLGIGIFSYFGFLFLSWKVALPSALFFSIATYGLTKYSLKQYYSKESEKQDFHENLRRQSDLVQELSRRADSNIAPKSASSTRKVIRHIDRPVVDIARSLARPAIGLQPLYPKILPQEPTACWVGGIPELPADFQWPVGRNLKNDSSVVMHFLAQIDCSKLPSNHSMGLPKEGTLTFFANFEAIPQQCAVYYNTNTANRQINPPKGLKPIFPNKNVSILSKTFIKPILFDSNPSYDHLFGSTHDNPQYQRPDWEDHVLEERSELLEIQHRQAFDYALKRNGFILPSSFKQIEPKVTIQIGGWARGSQGDLPTRDGDFVLLSLAHDELTGIMLGDIGDMNFVIAKDDLKKKDFSRVQFIMN